ncbi:AsmA family protein [Phyllobacterium leguminum]|uniref:AsmA-like protein n=1 Tax=Phyllobacterium leguminum TaxID=314237 RepID=A0A318T6W1_9HYPH|nr:AsmA family protein [Phyllobacterium leguminum]PYE90131.1 AsmA-like protein [Phyllobacterium leguminum]
MGRIFVFFGGLLVLLLTAALVVPPFIDWTGYRADFEREASRILGRPVTVAGAANARLLPFPSVTFFDVRVGDKGSQPAMTVEKFSMDAELMPFLRGQILIFDMRMEKPRALIAIDKTGRIDWAIHPAASLETAKVKLENLRITDGSIIVRDEAGNREHRISGINATMEAASLAGPWRFDGRLALDGQKAALEVTTGEVKPGGLRFSARIRPDAMPAVFETDGTMALAEGKLGYTGKFAIKSSDIAAEKLASGSGNAAKQARVTEPQERPFFANMRITGDFSADYSKLDMPQFRMEQGPADDAYVVDGKALFDYGSDPRFMISANGQQVLLDGAGQTGTASEPVAAVPLVQRIAAFRRLMNGAPIPTIPGSIDLRLPAIIAGDTTIRDVIVEAEPGGDGWNVKTLKADLPGRTQIEAKGKLLVGENFGFDGDLLMASRQPSGFAAWLTKDVGEAIRRLPGAGFSAKVSLHEGEQRADNLELALGGASLKGSFLRRSETSILPSMQLALEGGALDGDALAAFAALFASDSGSPRLADQDIDVKLKAGPVSQGGFEAASVDTAFRLRQGRFDIDRLIVSDLSGATLTATATLEPFKPDPSGSVDATILSDDLAPLIRKLAARYPAVPLFTALAKRAAAYPGLFSDSELTLVSNAVGPVADKAATVEKKSGSEFSFSAHGKIGGITTSVSGMARGNPWSDIPLELALTADAKTQGGEALMALIGLPALPLGLAGELESNLSLQGVPSEGMKSQLTLKAPDGSATVDGVFTLRPGDLTGSGKAVLKAADLQPFMAVTGYSLPGFGSGLPVDLASDFQFAKNIVRLPNLSGMVDGEPVTAKIEASLADNAEPRLKGEVKTGRLDLGSLAAFMLGPQAFEDRGGGQDNAWPDGAFAKAPAFPLLADLAVTADMADAGPLGEVTGFSAKIAKADDALVLNDLAGTLRGGKIGGNFSLRNTGGDALASTQFTWDGDIAGLYSLPDNIAPLSGKAKLTASLNGTGKTVGEVMASMAGSGILGTDGLSIEGLNPDGLRPILDAASKADPNAPAATLDAMTAEHLKSGAFRSGLAELAFTVAGGTARVPSFQLETEKSTLTSDLRLDLSKMTVGAQGSFLLKPGAEALAGAEPAVRFTIDGPYRDPAVTFDRQPLTQFLTQRALEREQDRVEAMQAALVEKQRLRREVALFEHQAEERRRAEEARKVAEQEEAARKATEAAARRAQETGSIPKDRPATGGSEKPLKLTP